MRLVAMSDTHNRHHKIVVPDGDLVIHVGDVTSRGYSQRFAAVCRTSCQRQPRSTPAIVFAIFHDA